VDGLWQIWAISLIKRYGRKRCRLQKACITTPSGQLEERSKAPIEGRPQLEYPGSAVKLSMQTDPSSVDLLAYRRERLAARYRVHMQWDNGVLVTGSALAVQDDRERSTESSGLDSMTAINMARVRRARVEKALNAIAEMSGSTHWHMKDCARDRQLDVLLGHASSIGLRERFWLTQRWSSGRKVNEGTLGALFEHPPFYMRHKGTWFANN